MISKDWIKDCIQEQERIKSEQLACAEANPPNKQAIRKVLEAQCAINWLERLGKSERQ